MWAVERGEMLSGKIFKEERIAHVKEIIQVLQKIIFILMHREINFIRFVCWIVHLKLLMLNLKLKKAALTHSIIVFYLIAKLIVF